LSHLDKVDERPIADRHETLAPTLRAAGIRLLLVVAHAEVRDILRGEGLEDRVCHLGRRVSVPDAINDFPSGTEIGTAA
jgi:hypothetical protein